MSKDTAAKFSLLMPSILGDVILKLPQVTNQTGKCRSSIYKGVKDGTFPAPIKLGDRAVGWLASEITAWIDSRKAFRQEVRA